MPKVSAQLFFQLDARLLSVPLRSHVLPLRYGNEAVESFFCRTIYPTIKCSILIIRCLFPTLQAADAVSIPDNSVSLVLLAGGVGKRMGAAIPKQYLELRGKPIATYSMAMFAGMPAIGEIVVVCEPEWKDVFEKCYAGLARKPPLKFARPGAERQDSVFNGLHEISESAALVAVHDSARPLITAKDSTACFVDAMRVGAAVLGVPVKPTIKEVDADKKVVKTLKRALLWEVQTPQVIRPELLRAGFELVAKEGLEVTDDVSIVEALGEPVLITPGAYTNIKVTTPDDMSIAERFLDEAGNA
jgi:2-C-methyl-D-erythritol 4-phosphate cytidylyltransferase